MIKKVNALTPKHCCFDCWFYVVIGLVGQLTTVVPPYIPVLLVAVLFLLPCVLACSWSLRDQLN